MTDTLEQILAKRRECQARIDAIRNEIPVMPILSLSPKISARIGDDEWLYFESMEANGNTRTLLSLDQRQTRMLGEFLIPLFPPSEPQQDVSTCSECGSATPIDQTQFYCTTCKTTICLSCSSKHAEHCK